MPIGIGTPLAEHPYPYLATVKKEVEAAIEDDLTLEQTVESVRMPEFEGYALNGWVHTGLNVPAAYKDLSTKQ